MFDICNLNAGISEQMCIRCLLTVLQQPKSYSQAPALISAHELCKNLLPPQDVVADTWLAPTGVSCTSCLDVLMSSTFHTCMLRAMLSKPCVLRIMLE